MNQLYVLYNPLAGNKDCEKKAKSLENLYQNKQITYLDITKMKDYTEFIDSLNEEDEILICGGDGTLNRFINDTYHLKIKNNILYYAAGNGNDFLRDLNKKDDAHPFRINKYLKKLPTVTVNGKTHYFLNGVGFGIDGYCCETGDILREKGKKPNYTMIAIKGLLYGYKPTAATVTVDGKTKTYKKMWIAPTMFGRFYGGGMMPTPKQSRTDKHGAVSFAAIHDSGKLHTLCVFPSIFKGTHVKHTAMVDIAKGHDITVEFDRPVALQIDGETVLGVKKYQVQSAALNSSVKKQKTKTITI